MYLALVDQLASIGTGDITAKRQAVTTATNTAYDELRPTPAV